MSDAPIDVDAQIENLRGLKTDLDACYWEAVEAGEPSLRFALGIAIGQLAQRISALEEVVRHHGADDVNIGHLSFDEYRAVEHALEVLDGEITVEKGARATKQLWPRVRAVLAAADDLLMAAARGERARSEDDGARRPRVVLPLVRSS
jgi:hypothetical protein